jgi:D-beta-D-heptose 7-phosphate kinase/D-beta-D-heptose 1-phosphate adenosyltransferase
MLSNFSEVLLPFFRKDLTKKIDIGVVGDVICDEYYSVEVKRISPEFPIPVYHSCTYEPNDSVVPGGAANVAYQFTNFNVQERLVSLINRPAETLFNSKGISTNTCKVVPNCVVPIKRRIYSHNLPLVRHDIERENYGLEDIKRHLLDLSVPETDFCIYSDYSKGLFSFPWFRKFLQKNPNIVDPKNNFIDLWEGCTYFKPNSNEAEKLSERKNVYDQLEFFIDALKCTGVLITQSGSGVVGKEQNGDIFEVRPSHVMANPESVIGAGDCFIAFTSMALARGFSLEEAARIAFVAGCCYVQKRHNSPLCAAEILSFIGCKKIDDPEILKRRNFKLAFANGCFDLGLTAPHVELLEFAKSKADKLVVALNTDASVARLKGSSRPIVPLEERLRIIASLGVVDYVVYFDEDTPYEIIKKIMPDLIVKGGDYKKDQVVGHDIVNVELFKITKGMSTTDKIKKILNK